MTDLRTYILFFIICLNVSVSFGQGKISLPSDSRIHKDINTLFRKYYSKQFLDPAIYQTKDMDLDVFYYTTEDTLKPDHITFEKFPGNFMDVSSPECLILVSPADTYPTGVIWGVPYAVLFVYRYQNNKWVLKYAGNFFGKLELISLNKNSKLNQIHVNIDYCNQGRCQWLTSFFHFKNNKLTELYSVTSYNNLMFLFSQLEGKKENVIIPAKGDTLGVESHLEEIKDLNGDNINEVVMKEEITLFNAVRENTFFYENVTRRKVYHYINGTLKLTEVSAYKRKELSDQLNNE